MRYVISKNFLKKPLMIIGLVAFFAFDEVFLIILFSKIGYPSFSTATWIAIGGGLVVLNVLLAVVIYRLIQTRPSTGTEGLAGQKGVVISSSGRRGKVLVRSEHWDAESSEDLNPGDEVTVSSLKGLVLVVKSSGQKGDHN